MTDKIIKLITKTEQPIEDHAQILRDLADSYAAPDTPRVVGQIVVTLYEGDDPDTPTIGYEYGEMSFSELIWALRTVEFLVLSATVEV